MDHLTPLCVEAASGVSEGALLVGVRVKFRVNPNPNNPNPNPNKVLQLTDRAATLAMNGYAVDKIELLALALALALTLTLTPNP